MQDVTVEKEQAPPAQDESSGSSSSDSWQEPEDEDRVHVEKRVRTSSPDYDPAEDVPKTYERRWKKTHRVMEETPVSAATHSEEHEPQTTTGPSESETEPRQKKGRKNKMPIKVRVVEEINRYGVPVKSIWRSFMMIGVRCQKTTRLTFDRIGLSGLEFP